jgi:hypothetical protein
VKWIFHRFLDVRSEKAIASSIDTACARALVVPGGGSM